VVADPLRQGLRQLTAVAVVGQHLVTARPFDRRRQRPGAGDLHLEVPGEALERLLQHVEVLAELAAGPPLVQARPAARQPPARGLEVGAELGDDGQRPARHRGGGAAFGELGQVRQVGQLAHDDAHGFVRVGPGEGADTRREGHAGVSTSSTDDDRAVAVMVAEPTTRVPSYTTAA